MKRIWGTLVVAGFLALGLISGCGSEKQAAQAEAGATQRPAATQETAQEPGTLTLAYTYQPKSGAWANQLAPGLKTRTGPSCGRLWLRALRPRGDIRNDPCRCLYG